MFNDVQMNDDQLKVAEKLPANQKENSSHGKGKSKKSHYKSTIVEDTQKKDRDKETNIKHFKKWQDDGVYVTNTWTKGENTEKFMNRARYLDDMVKNAKNDNDIQAIKSYINATFPQKSKDGANKHVQSYYEKLQEKRSAVQNDGKEEEIKMYEDSKLSDSKVPDEAVIIQMTKGGEHVVESPGVDDPNDVLTLSTLNSPTSILPGNTPEVKTMKDPIEPPKAIKRIEEEPKKEEKKEEKKEDTIISVEQFPESGMVEKVVLKLKDSNYIEKKNIIQDFFRHIKGIETKEVFNKFRDLWNEKYATLFMIKLDPWTSKIKLNGGEGKYLVGVPFKRIEASVVPARTTKPKIKVFSGPKKSVGSVFKAPKTANAKTFFTYDIHDIFRIIEGELEITLSEPIRLELEALIHVSVNEQINSHGCENGLIVRHGKEPIEKVISDIEDYINIRNKGSNRFEFTGQRRQQLVSILKRALKSNGKHGKNSLEIMDRISALRNFV